MPSITDWLMVVITAVYVIATIFISYSNKKSADVTREQLFESRRQYEDKKRLEIMPYIQFEVASGLPDKSLNLALNSGDRLINDHELLVSMKNIGNGTAKDITYIYQWDNFSKSKDRGLFPIQALSSGECQKIKLAFAYTGSIADNLFARFILNYKDLLDNCYTQQLTIKFIPSNGIILKLAEISTSSPVVEQKESADA